MPSAGGMIAIDPKVQMALGTSLRPGFQRPSCSYRNITMLLLIMHRMGKTRSLHSGISSLP